jgi:hypothetical protein
MLPSARGMSGSAYAPVTVAIVLSAVLQAVWLRYVATSGGDLAAQDAWAQFAHAHPSSAYDLAWYGGIHPVSYSVLSPFVMAVLGVRTTMVLASTAAAALLAWLLTRRMAPGWSRIVLAGVAAVAFLGNTVSGRVTFALGTAIALGAVCALVDWPREGRARWTRGVVVAVLSALATACSPVAGLFLGVVAATLWLRGRRVVASALGMSAVLVVGGSALLFPFTGTQPMGWGSAVLPATMAAAIVLLTPRSWRELRVGAGVYLVMVALAVLAPTPIGTNVTRLALVFSSVLLVAAALRGRWRSSVVATRLGAPLAAALLAGAVVTSVAWPATIAVRDAVRTRPPASLNADVAPLVQRLRAEGAVGGRIEVVPTRSHREAAALAPHFPLARGWNRQADVQRNPLFYGRAPLTAQTYREWLQRWSVRYVVLATTADPDFGGRAEARMVIGGLAYLHRVWSDPSWTVYEVRHPAPLVSPTATVVSFDADQVTVRTPAAGRYVVRVAASPWLSLVPLDGAPGTAACLSDLDSERPDTLDPPADNWTVLHAPAAGTYRIAAPYKMPRGTPCTK